MIDVPINPPEISSTMWGHKFRFFSCNPGSRQALFSVPISPHWRWWVQPSESGFCPPLLSQGFQRLYPRHVRPRSPLYLANRMEKEVSKRFLPPAQSIHIGKHLAVRYHQPAPGSGTPAHSKPSSPAHTSRCAQPECHGLPAAGVEGSGRPREPLYQPE